MTVTAPSSSTKADRSLRERYEDVRSRIAAAARRSGRSPSDVILVAVTKNASIDQIRELVSLGQVDLGENRVQNLQQRVALIDEFLQRRRQLGSAAGAAAVPQAVRWHMIGHLQRNKVKKAMGIVRLIHSLDTLRLAEEIQVASARIEEPVEVLIEINVSGEASKYGITPAAVPHFIEQIDTMLAIRPRGMMCMAPASDDPESSRLVFDRARELFEEIRAQGLGGSRFDILSMGMSNDFEVAIECGANIVRVGTAIFGSATVPDEPEEEEPA
jgi:PLP dependent protein